MTTATELREAANFVIDRQHCSSTHSVILARHILATVAVDGDEAVDYEWFRSLNIQERIVWKQDGKKYFVASYGYELPDGFARRQLRALLAALGIESK